MSAKETYLGKKIKTIHFNVYNSPTDFRFFFKKKRHVSDLFVLKHMNKYDIKVKVLNKVAGVDLIMGNVFNWGRGTISIL